MGRYNLDTLGIHELRDLAHVIGVKSPTTKNADQIKKEISDVLEGRAEPYVRPNRRGRPLKHNTNSFIKNENFIPTLQQLGQDLSTPYQFQTENYNWVVAMPHAMYTAYVDDTLDVCEGIVEEIKSEFGMLRKLDCQRRFDDIYISPILMKQYSLKTGDFVKGKCKFLSDDKPKAMVEVESVHLNKKYDFEEQGIGSGKTITTKTGNEISLGGKYILKLPETNRIPTYFEDICKSFENEDVQVCGIKLNADVSSLRQSGNILYIPFDLSDDQVASVTSLTFATFKRLMEEGKNVIVVIDSLTKYIKSVNMVVTNNAMHQTVSPNTLLATKQLVSIAKCINDEASITLVDIEGTIRPANIKDLFDIEISPLFESL